MYLSLSKKKKLCSIKTIKGIVNVKGIQQSDMKNYYKKASEYVRKYQSHTADQRTAPRGRATEH